MNNRLIKETLSDRSKVVCRAFLPLLLGLAMSISPAVAEEPGAEEFNAGLYHLEMGLYRTAAEWFHYSAEKDNVDAQFHLGLMFQRGDGVIQSYKTAIDWYQKAIKQDDDRAMNNLGCLYEKGQGVTQSYLTAITWFRKAAAHNNEIAIAGRI